MHVSTAYANCDQDSIEERIYPPPVDPERLSSSIGYEILLTILLQSQCNSMKRLSKHCLVNLFLPQISKGKWNGVLLCYSSRCLVFLGSVLYCLWLSKKILFLHNTETLGTEEIGPLQLAIHVVQTCHAGSKSCTGTRLTKKITI